MNPYHISISGSSQNSKCIQCLDFYFYRCSSSSKITFLFSSHSISTSPPLHLLVLQLSPSPQPTWSRHDPQPHLHPHLHHHIYLNHHSPPCLKSNFTGGRPPSTSPTMFLLWHLGRPFLLNWDFPFWIHLKQCFNQATNQRKGQRSSDIWLPFCFCTFVIHNV